MLPWATFDVVAAADGDAMWSEQYNDGKGFGKFVLIRHDETDASGNHYFTLYGHLADVAAGIEHRDKNAKDYDTWEPVERGQIIGTAGNTDCENPLEVHLHFEVFRGEYVANKTDPYDIETKREYYPGWPEYTECGSDRLWTADPPVLPSTTCSERLSVNVADGLPWFTKGAVSGDPFRWHSYTHDGQTYYYTNVSGDSANSWAGYRPFLAQAGTYKVTACFYPDPQNSDHVPHHIYHTGGMSTVFVDEYSDSWWARTEVELGSWNFAAGSSSYVLVSDATGDTPGTCALNVDTIKFELQVTDTTPPTCNLSINSGESTTTTLLVTLYPNGSDSGGSGLSQMRFSNNNSTWSSWEAYSSTKSNWDLSSYGGNSNSGTKTTYAEVKDHAGNVVSSPCSDSIQYQPGSSPVNFPDPGLEAAIRDAIGKPTGDILDTDLIGLAQLNANSRSISNLEGIQNCVDLTNLDLGWNWITDISPLSALANLTVLDLHGNNWITDISPLESLTNLMELDLHVNQIVDISPLSDLVNLTWLHLGSNQIVDLNPLSGLINLMELSLWQNSIVDISPLSGLTNLMVLFLGRNQITDISPLSSLTNLTKLLLEQNWTVVDISPLASLTNLMVLELGDNQIVDISPLESLTNLMEIDLQRNQIVDISPLSGLINLAELNMDNNLIVDINPVESLTNLMVLELPENQIVDINPLSGLTNLMNFYLGWNQIVDISPLSGLTNLAELHMNNNPIVDISPLSGLINLRELLLMDNQITNIHPLVLNPGIDSGDGLRVIYNYLDLAAGSQAMTDIQILLG